MSIIEKAIGKNEVRKETDQARRRKVRVSEDDIHRRRGVSSSKEPRSSKDASDRKTKKILIDRKRLAVRGFLSTNNTNSRIYEEYRVIKRPIVNNAILGAENGIKRANLILITSSQPGEGKTFTAVNLALSIANERDKKVLLIDADVAKPSISRLLGIKENRRGLIDYLDGKEPDFSKIMLETNIPGLSIVPAGRKHGYSTELLASNRMEKLVEELHSRYPDRIVIFDSPPLLAATQAEVLAGLVGQVILVVEAENTVQRMVAESMDKLKICDVVMGVLNKSVHSYKLDYGYGQYGHYGH
jgi:exopolysaccharide/PEP-CTERM locus tyrosine autokinase